MTLDLDLERPARTGFGEVVYAAGKTIDECVTAACRIDAANGRVLVTRASAAQLTALLAALPDGQGFARSGAFLRGAPSAEAGPVAVVSAGTSD